MNKTKNNIFVVIPAFNEALSIAKVIKDIPKEWVEEIIVVDNNSTDNTDKIAQKAGAIVLKETNKGYGYACLKGIEYAINQGAEILVFMDGDYADYPEELPKIVKPILSKKMDLVIGSRALGEKEKKSMTIPQVFGNWLATRLMCVFYGIKFTDLGPFRAITVPAFDKLKMNDKTYGWTIEMQIKAAKHHLKTTEVPVNYKARIGKSKVSGTIKGTVMAGYKILFAILKYKFTD